MPLSLLCRLSLRRICKIRFLFSCKRCWSRQPNSKRFHPFPLLGSRGNFPLQEQSRFPVRGGGDFSRRRFCAALQFRKAVKKSAVCCFDLENSMLRNFFICLQDYSAAVMTALMSCIRFPASSKAMDWVPISFSFSVTCKTTYCGLLMDIVCSLR